MASDTWKTVKAEQVKAGDTVRTQSGSVVIVSRVEKSFMGLPNMLAVIEDTEDRWFKQPLTADSDVEVRSS
jgi:preprotein translocase subunit YajC